MFFFPCLTGAAGRRLHPTGITPSRWHLAGPKNARRKYRRKTRPTIALEIDPGKAGLAFMQLIGGMV